MNYWLAYIVCIAQLEVKLMAGPDSKDFEEQKPIREVTRQFQPSSNKVIQSILVRFTVAPP